MTEIIIAPDNCCLYPARRAPTRFSSYSFANLSCVPNAWTVRTLEMISSAIVDAFPYSFMARVAYLAIRVPPTTKIVMIAGTMQLKMNAKTHCLTNAMTNAEKKDERADITIEIYH